MGDVRDLRDYSGLTRGAKHYTLGDLITDLQPFGDFPLNRLPVVFLNGTLPERLISYRGYYEDLAIARRHGEATAGEFLAMCREAVGTVFIGYKGGYYEAGLDTPIWVSEYGDASGMGLIGVERGMTVVRLVCASI